MRGFWPAITFALTLALTTSRASAADEFEPSDGRELRVTVEVLGAVGVGTVGGLVAAGLTDLATASANDRCRDGLGCMGPGIVNLFAGCVGATFAVPAGITLAGALSGANGTYWAALAGTGVGLVADLGLVLAADALGMDLDLVGVGVLLAVPIVGGVIGYELSTERVEGASSTAASLSYVLAPPTMLQLAGSF